MGISKVIFLDDTLEKMKIDYLYHGNDKYLRFNKKLYGIDYDKWSNYFWDLYIVRLFEEEIKERLFEIEHIEEIAKNISQEIKIERERIIIYSYVQGYVLGYKNLALTKELSRIFKKVFTEKKVHKLHISDMVRSRHLKNYNEAINKELEKVDNRQYIEKVVLEFCKNIVYPKLESIHSRYNFIVIRKVIFTILVKDCIEKNRDGIWDGIIVRVLKEFDKKYKIML